MWKTGEPRRDGAVELSPPYAHTLPGRPEAEWQDLREHLEGVAERAAASAAFFGAGEWARAAGLWHDLGKYSDAFQDYLKKASSADPHIADTAARTDHSTAGAQHAAQSMGVLGHLLAYPLAGHHSGLLDGRGPGPCLEARLTKSIEPWSGAPAPPLAASDLKLPHFVAAALDPARRDPFCVAFFVRMLFSCLVDGDFLDSERFMSPERATARPRWEPDILSRIEAALECNAVLTKPRTGAIDELRDGVRRACLAAAEEAPGLFSLTVPTGGGKTLSSLAFALRHAIRNDLRRIVYVAPFTTIIEQNADVFRKVMSPLAEEGISDPVVEHHSSLDEGEETVTSRLAAENWDAPLIVTTSVQLFESLFASRTSRCRKLHRLARAVIILDEAQTLPVDLLEPSLRSLRELADHYGASIVLCTATQPAVHRRESFEIGLDGVREIIPDPQRLYRALKRVEVGDLGSVNDGDLARRLSSHKQVLCVVNTRGLARALFEALADSEGRFHLSATMCPVHRSKMLAKIHRRLRKGATCRLVSTQLIEAGVDIDFPTVYRSLAGLDSIAQAAGRCNRNGSLAGPGRVFVFRSEHVRAERFFRDTTNCARQVLPLFEEDPLSLEAIERYFELYYWEQTSRWDAKRILDEFHLIQDRSLPFSFGFATVADRYRLIEDGGRPVIIPWGDRGVSLCDRLRRPRAVPDRTLLRALQRFTVQVPERAWKREVGRSIELVHDQYPVLTSPELCYSEETGLAFDANTTGFLNV